MNDQQPPESPPQPPPTPPAYQPPPTPPPAGDAPPPAETPPTGDAPPPTGLPPGAASAPPGIGPWLNEAWALVTSNLGACIGMMFIPLVPALIAGIPVGLAMMAARGNAEAAAGFGIVGGIVSLLIMIVVMPAVMLGVHACFWEMIQTKRLTFNNITAGLPMFGSAIGMGILFGIIAAVLGFIAGLIPVIGALASFVIGFPLAAWIAMSFYHMVVRRGGALDSISAGWTILTSDLFTLSLLGFVSWVINIIGMIACGVGVLVAGPVVIAAWGVCYRDMSAKAGV